jgi:hypothetical protein
MFTFKKDPPETGLARILHIPGTTIKIRKRECGRIYPCRVFEDGWRIQVAVKDGDSWKWIGRQKPFSSEPEAREWLNKNFTFITFKYDIHFFKD